MAVSAFLQPQIGGPAQFAASEVAPIAKTFAQVQQAWMTQPGTMFAAQEKLWQSYAALWSSSMLQAVGMGCGEVAASASRDNRFKDPAWTENPFFDLMRQSYLITSHWAASLVARNRHRPIASTCTINFNHTSINYVFASAISGNGTVNVLAGTITATGTNSPY